MEFEHRLLNGLQMISSLLMSQSRVASSEAAAQLVIAAGRISAFERVHRGLHLLDHREHVEFRQYLRQLCEDLSSLLFQSKAGRTIVVKCGEIALPATFAIPLSFIVNELITNSAKYSDGNIAVQLEALSIVNYSLSVSDDGPGFPAGFDPESGEGLGMKIVLSLVKQIGGEFHIAPGRAGACFRITFRVPSDWPSQPISKPMRSSVLALIHQKA